MAVNKYYGQNLVQGQNVIAPIFRIPPQKSSSFVYLTKRLSPADYHIIKRCRAVICEEGGSNDHAAVICRILGRPLIILDQACKQLPDGCVVAIDGQTGAIETGMNHSKQFLQPVTAFSGIAQFIAESQLKIQVSIVGEDEIKLVNKGFRKPVHQFFLREELIWASEGLNPFKFIAKHGVDAAAKLLANHLNKCLKFLSDGQLINYRSLDWRPGYSDDDNEVLEPNPELGLHGVRRLLVQPEILIAELRAIQMIKRQDSKRIVFSLPFLTDQEELEAVRNIAAKQKVDKLRIGLFIETAAAVIEIKELITPDIVFVCIGTKDLTQMILGCDRNNKNVQHIYDCTKRPVTRAINAVLHTGSKAGKSVVVFSNLKDLKSIIKQCPQIREISICAGEYIQIQGLLEQGKKIFKYQVAQL